MAGASFYCGEKLPEDFRHGGDREFLKSPWMQSKSLGDPLFLSAEVSIPANTWQRTESLPPY